MPRVKIPIPCFGVFRATGWKKPSYLFGTHHLIPISFLDNIEGLESAFESTEQTVGEIDLNEMNHLQLKLMSEALIAGRHYLRFFIECRRHCSTWQRITRMGRSWAGFIWGKWNRPMLSNLISVTLYKKYYPPPLRRKKYGWIFSRRGEQTISAG